MKKIEWNGNSKKQQKCREGGLKQWKDGGEKGEMKTENERET